MKKRIAVLPGDGIGPEIMEQAIKVLNAIEKKFGHEFKYHSSLIGAAAIRSEGSPLPIETLDNCHASDAVLLAAIGEPEFNNNPDLKMRPEQGLLGLRKSLDLFANLRPIKTNKNLSHLSMIKSVKDKDLDFMIFRELSSGIYYGKRSEGSDEASDECYYNREEITRVSIKAFEEARKRNKRLCLVDKANVLASSRLWRKVINDLSKDYEEVELSALFVDNAVMQMVLNPAQFDVIVCGNMFGDILSDLASTIPGSLGLLPSASLGEKNALFEPVHGSYPEATGKNIANPIAMIRSAEMMLQYFGLHEEAAAIDNAIEFCLRRGLGTPDLNPQYIIGTSEVGELICDIIEDGKLSIDLDNKDQRYSTII